MALASRLGLGGGGTGAGAFAVPDSSDDEASDVRPPVDAGTRAGLRGPTARVLGGNANATLTATEAAPTETRGRDGRRGRRVAPAQGAGANASVGGDFAAFMKSREAAGMADGMSARLASLGLNVSASGALTGAMGSQDAMEAMTRNLNVLYRTSPTATADAPMLVLLHANPTDEEARRGKEAAHSRRVQLGDDALAALPGWAVAIPVGNERHVRPWGVACECWADPLAESLRVGGNADIKSNIDALSTLAELEEATRRMLRSVVEARAGARGRAVFVGVGRAASAVALMASLGCVTTPALSDMPTIAGAVLVADEAVFTEYAANKVGKRCPVVLVAPPETRAGDAGLAALAEVGVPAGVLRAPSGAGALTAAYAAAKRLEAALARGVDGASALQAAGATALASETPKGGGLRDAIDVPLFR